MTTRCFKTIDSIDISHPRRGLFLHEAAGWFQNFASRSSKASKFYVWLGSDEFVRWILEEAKGESWWYWGQSDKLHVKVNFRCVSFSCLLGEDLPSALMKGTWVRGRLRPSYDFIC